MTSRWLSTFVSVVVGSASVLLAVWAVWLMVDPHETIHFEYAIPGLAVAIAGAFVAVLLWRRSGQR